MDTAISKTDSAYLRPVLEGIRELGALTGLFSLLGVDVTPKFSCVKLAKLRNLDQSEEENI